MTPTEGTCPRAGGGCCQAAGRRSGGPRWPAERDSALEGTALRPDDGGTASGA